MQQLLGRVEPRTVSQPIQALVAALCAEPDLEFAVLVGSQATGNSTPSSDWDIALHWAPATPLWNVVARTETLRCELAKALGVEASAIDLIDLHRANLAMRASVAEEGVPLYGEDTLAWGRFLRRTWRDLEDFYWDKQHAA